MIMFQMEGLRYPWITCLDRTKCRFDTLNHITSINLEPIFTNIPLSTQEAYRTQTLMPLRCHPAHALHRTLVPAHPWPQPPAGTSTSAPQIVTQEAHTRFGQEVPIIGMTNTNPRHILGNRTINPVCDPLTTEQVFIPPTVPGPLCHIQDPRPLLLHPIILAVTQIDLPRLPVTDRTV